MNNDIDIIKTLKRSFINDIMSYGVQYDTTLKISAALEKAIESLAAPSVASGAPELPWHDSDFCGWLECRTDSEIMDEFIAYGQSCAAAERTVGVNAQLVEALTGALAVIDDYLAYDHNGDPWTEDARTMGEMDIDDYKRDGRLNTARAALAAAGVEVKP